MLTLESDLEVVGVANNGQTAIEQVEALKPDIVLMDVQMPIMDGREATRIIAQQFPDTKVIVLSTFDDDQYIFESIKAGAKSYLLKDTPSEELTQVIQCVHYSDRTQLDSGLMKKLMKRFPEDDEQVLVELTSKQQEVLGWIGMGKTNDEIADQLNMGKGTVKTHVTQIRDRLNLKNRVKLGIYAYVNRKLFNNLDWEWVDALPTLLKERLSNDPEI